jgi:hypothetical protein
MVQLPKREESTSEFVIPAEDTYTMVLDRLSEERLGKFPDKNGVLHPEQEFYFKILDDEEYEGCELRVYVRVDTFHDGSGGTQPAKVFLISKALLGASFDPNVPPDTEDLVGLKCRATVAHRQLFPDAHPHAEGGSQAGGRGTRGRFRRAILAN